MKLTRERLKQIIKEELEDMQQQASVNPGDIEMLKSILKREGLIGKTFKAEEHHGSGVQRTAVQQLGDTLNTIFHDHFNYRKKHLKGESEVSGEEFANLLNQVVKIVTDQGQIAEINFKIGNPPFKPSIPAASFTLQAI